MRLYMLLLLVPLIFASGCIGSVRTDTNNGLVVDTFEAYPNVAEAGDNVRFYLDVQNVGGTTATCVTSTLYGADDWYDAMTGAQLSCPSALVPQQGIILNIFSGGLDFCYFDVGQAYQGSQACLNYREDYGVSLSAFMGNAFYAFSDSYCNRINSYVSARDACGRTVKLTPALTPPSPERNKQGQTWTTEWILKPPVLPEGIRSDYTVTARTEYFYTSNAHVKINAFNKEEYRARQISGDPAIASGPIEIDNVYGAPIQITATRGDNPMVINTAPIYTNQPLEYFSYTFELTNVGNGYPLSFSGMDLPATIGAGAERGYVFATATINGPGAVFSNCLGQYGTAVTIPSSYLENMLKIRSDRTAPFSCQIAVDRSRWIDNPMGTITITFQTFYRYYTDAETTVRVIGPERY